MNKTGAGIICIKAYTVVKGRALDLLLCNLSAGVVPATKAAYGSKRYKHTRTIILKKSFVTILKICSRKIFCYVVLLIFDVKLL